MTPGKDSKRFAVFVCLCLSLTAFVSRYPNAPPMAHTGGFGEPTCLACHRSEDLNAPGGELRLEGVPRRWRPGTTYPITIVMQRDSIGAAGFQLAVRFPDGTQAGGLASTDTARTGVTEATARQVQYAHHLLPGIKLLAGQGRWVVLWTAPQAPGEGAIFHAVAVAANDDNSNLGDYVHTATAESGHP